VTRRDELIAFVVGLLVLVVGCLVVGDGNVPGWEESVFRAVNDLPDWLYPIVLPGNLLGALVIAPIVAVLALSVRQYWLALAIVIAGVLKLVTERVVKAVVTRERPGTSIGSDIETRGDVSVSGESFVSGHAILAAAVATVVAPYVPPRGRIALGLVVVFVMFARVYVGAHNPLDVICGAGLGVALGAAINLVLGAPRRSAVAQ
jgi:glycosyltransferase 2 family protein